MAPRWYTPSRESPSRRSAQQAVACDKFERIGDVVELEIVAGNCVSDFTHREITGFDDVIEQLFDDLAKRDAFRQVLRQKSDFDQCLAEHRAQRSRRWRSA